MKLDLELSRAHRDQDLIPYVYIKILDLYIIKYSSHETYIEFRKGYPHDMMDEMKEMKLEIGYGIQRVKKIYPNLCREFKEELEILFDRSTENLNREQKRMLR